MTNCLSVSDKAGKDDYLIVFSHHFTLSFHKLLKPWLRTLITSLPLCITCSATTSTKAPECVDHRAEIRPTHSNIYSIHSLICLFVWRRLLSRCAYPTHVSLLGSSCTPPLQMAWHIQLKMPRADSLIEVASLSHSVLFFLFAVTGVLLPIEQHNTSCHLT